jgi:hypothetical protein
MSTQWLAVQSFQHSQDLLTAINTLSMHIKLKLAGIPDKGRVESAERAQEKLGFFFKELEMVMKELQHGEAKPMLGVDLRLRQLARNFIEAKRNRNKFRSPLFRDTISNVLQLLASDRGEDRRSVVKCLEELRTLLEEHVHTDAAQILGEI